MNLKQKIQLFRDENDKLNNNDAKHNIELVHQILKELREITCQYSTAQLLNDLRMMRKGDYKMKEIYKITLNPTDVAEFNRVAESFTNDINVSQGSIVANAKSFLGVCTLDLKQDINLIIRECNVDILAKFEKWIVE